MTTERICYHILETVTNDNGEYIPCIVKENVSGYFKTDWFWGKDINIARQCAKEKNEALELTDDDVNKIISSSMKDLFSSNSDIDFERWFFDVQDEQSFINLYDSHLEFMRTENPEYQINKKGWGEMYFNHCVNV